VLLRWPAWLALFCVLFPGIGWPAAPLPLPALSTRVTDLTNTLDATQRGRLEAQLAAIDRSGRAQIAVLLLPTTQPETIEQFGIRLAEAWKIGRKGDDNGLMVIVAKDDRRMRIEVGYGLEGVVPDAIAGRIVNERMAPAFRQGDYFGGLRAAVEALDQAMGGAPVLAPATAAQPAPRNTNTGGGDIPGWAFIFLFGSGILNAIFGLFGSLLAAGIGGWLGFMFFGNWLGAAIAAVVVFLFSLGKMSSGGGVGGFSGGGGFSSGGGGFSGGGGSFGGGGSSGSW
jgi:uncharacterized protein